MPTQFIYFFSPFFYTTRLIYHVERAGIEPGNFELTARSLTDRAILAPNTSLQIHQHQTLRYITYKSID